MSNHKDLKEYENVDSSVIAMVGDSIMDYAQMGLHLESTINSAWFPPEASVLTVLDLHN